MLIISGNSQSRWKDSVASAPAIDLCLIANGEERTQVFSSKGILTFAGIEAPTIAPTISIIGAGNLTNLKWVAYVYVYAATTKYPLVQSIQGANGNLSVRSNASPHTSFEITGGNRELKVKCTKTSARPDVTKIWIYRTQLFDSEELADTAAEAGLLFYIGELDNDGNPGVENFSDNSLVVQEQIESDNLVAPTAQFAAYYDPYFFLFGQNELNVEVELTSAGVITLISTFDGTWFDGRNGQFVKLQGVDTGGFDGFGTFYFKYISPTTAQLTFDQAGTIIASAPYFGTTKVKIYGFPTTLYRSKPNNPFAWGETVTVGTAVVARSWVMKVGGGKGIAMTVIPSSSLLKLDLDNPTRSYVFNLKQTQTDAFKSTRRLISDTYIPSGNFCQFTGLDQNKQLQTFAIDSRNYTITQTDGGNVVPIGDAVQLDLRDIIQQSSEHVHFHGLYDPNTELNCFFYRTQGGLPTVHKMIYQHAPSGQWGTWDCFDILCSAVVEDAFTGQTISLCGTVAGFVGRLFSPDRSVNWIEDYSSNDRLSLGSIISVGNIQQDLQVAPPEVTEDLDGRYFVLVTTYQGLAQYNVIYFGSGSGPDYEVKGSPGNTDPNNYVIFKIAVSGYTSGIAQDVLAEAIHDAIQTAKYDVMTYPNFGLDSTYVASNTFLNVTWTYPVLYSIPLNEYFDVNSGTTFDNLDVRGGAVIRYLAGSWSIYGSAINDNTRNRYIGNWVQLMADLGPNLTLWGRIKYIENETDTQNITLYLDLIYFPDSNQFIFSLEGYDDIAGGVFVGETECRLRKYFDFGEATEIKNINEIWATVENTNNVIDYDKFKIALLAQLEDQLEVNPSSIYLDMLQDVSVDSSLPLNGWFIRSNIQVSPFKIFGFIIIQRGPDAFKISNITLKV